MLCAENVRLFEGSRSTLREYRSEYSGVTRRTEVRKKVCLIEGISGKGRVRPGCQCEVPDGYTLHTQRQGAASAFVAAFATAALAMVLAGGIRVICRTGRCGLRDLVQHRCDVGIVLLTLHVCLHGKSMLQWTEYQGQGQQQT